MTIKSKKPKNERNDLQSWNEVIQKHHSNVEFKKPERINIEKLFDAFQKFQLAHKSGVSSVREPKKWQKMMDEAREQFKEDIGDLANYIDWSE